MHTSDTTPDYAPLKIRIAARALDFTIYYVTAFIIYYLLSNTAGINDSLALKANIFGGAMILRWLVYYPVMESRGGIIGKILVGIKTVSRVTLDNLSINLAYKKTMTIVRVWLWLLPLLMIGNTQHGLLRDVLVFSYYGLCIIGSIPFYKKFGFYIHDYRSVSIVVREGSPITEKQKQYAAYGFEEEPDESAKPNIFKKALSSMNGVRSFVLACIVTVFAQVIMNQNKNYQIAHEENFLTAEQYTAFIRYNDGAPLVEVSISYFKVLPGWTINLVYLTYFILAVIGVFWFMKAIKTNKKALSIRKKIALLNRMRSLLASHPELATLKDKPDELAKALNNLMKGGKP
jgi:hypothetical protein